ncbi:MAG: ATP-binding protein [Nanoarchaeota archaeon]|nr:ATP-binding protein [Nanoarchaeota archaeon]MBU4456641.1 ATP-binding protein [Nanoarchaeota archaeon]MCG2719195.1 ATP-binding protein [Nanoarchaeota archaeon]
MVDAILSNSMKYPLKALMKHFIALGSTGSGKTVLSKVLIEEAAMNGIPSIIVDPQGDLASLAMYGTSEKVDQKRLDQFKKSARVVIFTPTSSKGIPLFVNPLKLPSSKLGSEEVISIINQISTSIARLIGYDINKDSGKNAQVVLYLLLMDCWKSSRDLKTFDKLSDLVLNLPESVQKEGEVFVKDVKALAILSKKLKYLTIGEKELLFQFGVPLDIDTLLGKGQKKTQISIIYLNTINTIDEKQFFVSMLATELYQWMLSHPSKDLQAIFMIDEVASFIPAGAEKPMAKEILKLIYKQARKYGIGCITGTQNPGDIDYKAFAQFGTWAIGRLVTKQDIAKVKTALESLAMQKTEKVLDVLPRLKSGEFLMFCPDIFKDVINMKVRWLLTEHKTLTEDDVKLLTTVEDKDFYEQYAVKKPKLKKERSQEKGIEHFDVCISDEEADKIINRKKRKLFWLFGPPTETLESLKLMLKPIIRAEAVRAKQSFFGKKLENFTLNFDGVTGGLIKIKHNGKIKSYRGWQEMLGLSEREISVIKLMFSKWKNRMTNAEIASRLMLTDNFVNQVTNGLMKKKLLSYVGKKRRAYLWMPLINVKVPMNAKKLLSYKLETSNAGTKGHILNSAVKLNDLTKLVKEWLDVSITDTSIIYYPYYEAKLVGKKRSRIIRISALNGKVIA